MATPKISPDMLEIIQQEARKQAEAVYAQKGTQYNVPDVPTHTHNSVDSVQLPSFNSIPNSGNGVLSPTKLIGVLDGGVTASQQINQAATRTPSLSNILSVSIPVIQGFGTTFGTNLSGIPAAGATSGTLAAGAWGGTTETVAAQFADGEIRNVKYTNGSATVTWTPGLTYSPGAVTLTQIANSRFHGGDAPLGTSIVFVNTDDGITQLWIRADLVGGTPSTNDLVAQWIGFDAANLAP